jgi:hypothetical protein
MQIMQLDRKSQVITVTTIIIMSNSTSADTAISTNEHCGYTSTGNGIISPRYNRYRDEIPVFTYLTSVNWTAAECRHRSA